MNISLKRYTNSLITIRQSLLVLFISFSFITVQESVYAEGTATVSPSSANVTALALLPTFGSGDYLGCPQDNRIYFNIANNATENLYFGFNWHNYASSGSSPTISNMYIKIFNPSGALVSGPTQLNNSGAGFISTYAQAVAGPNVAGSAPTGYTPLSFDPSVNGDYWIEVYRSNDGGATQASNATWSLAPYFDLTVATATGVRSNGRVHSDKWAFVAIDASFLAQSTASSQVSVYAYTSDQTVLNIGFQSGFKPIAFDLAVNLYGVTNTSNYATDRKSINSATTPILANGYPLFLNSPDPAIYPIAAIPPNPSFASPLFIGCTSGNPQQIRYTLPVAGDTRLFFDLNGVAGYQAGTADRIVEIFSETAGFHVYNWDGLNGLGVAVAANSSFSLTLTALQGRFNVPLYDAEINKNGLKVSAIAPIASTAIMLYWDDASLTNIGNSCSSSADNENNVTGSGLNNIGGTLSPAHAWSGNGNPTQIIPAPAVGTNETDNLQCNDFGNARVINTYGWAVSTFTTAGNIVAYQCINLSGTVWIDADSSAAGTSNNIFTTGEVGTNVGGTLYATLIDPATGNVLQSVAVAANGTYSFTGVPTNATNMVVRITNSLGVIGSTPPAIATLPTGWTNTSPLSQTVSTGTTNITGIDFGVRQIPPTVTVAVDNTILCVGGSAVLTATASSGNGTYTYQWQSSNNLFTWTAISGATNATYTAPTGTASLMWYRVVVTSGGLSVTSSIKSIVVVNDPVVSITTTTPIICTGGAVVLHSSSSGGTGTCTLQWQSSPNGTTWTDISGATNATYTTPSLSSGAPLRYRVQISCTGNGCCN